MPSASIVIRLARSHKLKDRVHKRVELGRWFERVNAPVIHLALSVAQPVRAGDLLASMWQYVPPAEPARAVKDLGRVQCEFHSIGPLSMPLPA